MIYNPNPSKFAQTFNQSCKNPSPQPSSHLPPKTSGSPPRLQFPTHLSPKSLSDKDLYSRCQLYGGNAKKWLQKFAGLLPEVYRRFLYKKHGCGSIHEFAQKLSGMHERTTDKILNLHRRLEDKPHLLALFESGEQGWSKIEAVAFLATPETEKDLAEKVKNLPFRALVIYTQTIRGKITGAGQARNDLRISQVPASVQLTLLHENKTPSCFGLTTTNFNKSQDPHDLDLNSSALDSNSNPIPGLPLAAASESNLDSSLALTALSPLLSYSIQTTTTSSSYHETFTSFSFPISTRSRQKLNIVKLTLEKQHRQTLTWNQVIALWPIHNQKIIIKKVCPTCALKLANPTPVHIRPQNPSPSSNPASHKSSTHANFLGSPSFLPVDAGPHKSSIYTTPPGRPIPAPIKNLILAAHGQTCAFPGCNEAFTEFHHIEPFAIHKTHNPNRIYPVCFTHRTLFHAGLVANSEKPPAF